MRGRSRRAAFGCVVAFAAGFAANVGAAEEPALPVGLAPKAEEPALPSGLEPKADEPALPKGLGGSVEEPSLPSGLDSQLDEPALPADLGETVAKAPADEAPAQPLGLTGFWEARGGTQFHDRSRQRDESLGETRLQLEGERQFGDVLFSVTAHLLYDGLADDHDVDLEGRETVLDLRQGNAQLSPLAVADVKLGRQILTWGTGDLIFINDLFPKDFKAFFIGRDFEYLKSPSDAVRLSLFGGLANLNVVYTPRFDPDRFLDGRRISFFDFSLGRIAGRDVRQAFTIPDGWFDDDEWAVRLYRNVGAFEVAFYAYEGLWKSPAGTDPVSGAFTFPHLRVAGASALGPIGPGIANIEVAYYDSTDDSAGDNPLVENSEFRSLVGYTREIARDLSLGVQYYLEYMDDYDDYRRTLPAGVPPADEDRHVFTVRLTWLTFSQNLEWSFFGFFSPSDEDAYLRPKVHYKVDDHWSVEAGANVFLGRADSTFFGQFEDNSNAYVGVRYGF